MPTIELAQQWYLQDDPVHGFDHILRVYHLAERLAQEEGADLEVVRAAALLHDAEGNATADASFDRLDHHHSSASFARKTLLAEGWSEARIAAVEHCIRAHRFRDRSEQPLTLEAQVLYDADKLDAIGATGVARAIAYAAAHRQPFYSQPSSRFLELGELEPGEGHSAYHEYLFKLSKIKDGLYTQAGRTLAQGRHTYMVSFFKRLEKELCLEA